MRILLGLWTILNLNLNLDFLLWTAAAEMVGGRWSVGVNTCCSGSLVEHMCVVPLYLISLPFRSFRYFSLILRASLPYLNLFFVLFFFLRDVCADHSL